MAAERRGRLSSEPTIRALREELRSVRESLAVERQNKAREQQNADMVGSVKRASDEELVRAREVLVGLRRFYALYVLHGLLLPDNPALAALRQRIDARGMFPILDQIIGLNPSPRQFAESLAICMEPPFDTLYETLLEQLGKDPDIFHIPATTPVRPASARPGCAPYANCRPQGDW